MTTVLWVAVALTVWVCIAGFTGVTLGRTIRFRDRQVPHGIFPTLVRRVRRTVQR